MCFQFTSPNVRCAIANKMAPSAPTNPGLTRAALPWEYLPSVQSLSGGAHGETQARGHAKGELATLRAQQTGSLWLFDESSIWTNDLDLDTSISPLALKSTHRSRARTPQPLPLTWRLYICHSQGLRPVVLP
jgi:hypothetical protein